MAHRRRTDAWRALMAMRRQPYVTVHDAVQGGRAATTTAGSRRPWRGAQRDPWTDRSRRASFGEGWLQQEVQEGGLRF
jgi:hypothetical protein